MVRGVERTQRVTNHPMRKVKTKKLPYVDYRSHKPAKFVGPGIWLSERMVGFRDWAEWRNVKLPDVYWHYGLHRDGTEYRADDSDSSVASPDQMEETSDNEPISFCVTKRGSNPPYTWFPDMPPPTCGN